MLKTAGKCLLIICVKKRQERSNRETEQFPTIHINRQYDSVEEYVKKIKAEGRLIDVDAEDMLINTTIRETDEENLTLVEAAPRDIGLTEGMPYGKEIFQAAKERGWEICPPWVALQHRLDCDNNSRTTAIGTEPINTGEGEKAVFVVSRDQIRGDGVDGNWNPDIPWLFVVSSKE